MQKSALYLKFCSKYVLKAMILRNKKSRKGKQLKVPLDTTKSQFITAIVKKISKVFLVQFLTTIGVAEPLKNYPFLLRRSMLSFRHL